MLKKVSLLALAAALLVCLAVPAFAATEDITLKYILDANNSTVDASGNNVITVKSGDIVTVTYFIENASSDEDADTATTQNQIKYDHNFFQLVDNSIELDAEAENAFSTSCPVDSDANQTHYIFFNSVSSLSIYSKERFGIGSFQLKVIAKSGSSTIVNTQYKATDSSARLFDTEKQDLVVIIEGSEIVPATGINLDKTNITLIFPNSETLDATVTPSNATNREIIWNSSNPAVASVNNAGTVKANSIGTATITAITADGGKTATCTVTVTKDGSGTDSGGKTDTGSTPENLFVDITAGAYFYDAVLWASENGITQGTDATHFSPNMGTTRAQVVTFLWRAAGCPEPSGNASQFSDVVSGSYYEKAVAWAVAQGITNGTSKTTFSPNKVCTRGQIVTFLARYAGVNDTETASIFTDVKSTDYYAAAVKWAKDNGVTSGTSATTFSPNLDCTRAQAVTFLYRWMVR